MKNLNTRTVLLTLLVIASLSSYIFLQTESSKVTSDNIEEIEMDNKDQSHIYLPDVELVKKVIQVSKALLHPLHNSI